MDRRSLVCGGERRKRQASRKRENDVDPRHPDSTRGRTFNDGRARAPGGQEATLRYILLIHAEEEVWTRYDEKAQAEQMSRHEDLERDLRKAGKYVDCGGLATTNTVTTVRHKEGQTFVTDGPYAEAREQFGGYYVVDAKDLDDAIAIARRIPVTTNGGVEIRRVEVGPLAE